MEVKEYKSPVLFISSTAIEARTEGLAREFFGEVLHKRLTMVELQEKATEKNVRIGELPGGRPEKQQSDLNSFGIFKIYDKTGEEFEAFEPGSKEWNESYQGLINARIDRE